MIAPHPESRKSIGQPALLSSKRDRCSNKTKRADQHCQEGSVSAPALDPVIRDHRRVLLSSSSLPEPIVTDGFPRFPGDYDHFHILLTVRLRAIQPGGQRGIWICPDARIEHALVFIGDQYNLECHKLLAFRVLPQLWQLFTCAC